MARLDVQLVIMDVVWMVKRKKLDIPSIAISFNILKH